MTEIKAIYNEGSVIDIEANLQGRSIRMLGEGGKNREERLLAPWQNLHNKHEVLPVLLGSGIGFALEQFLLENQGPIAIVDKELSILELTKLQERFLDQRIAWFCVEKYTNEDSLINALQDWQKEHNDRSLFIINHPFYQRLDSWYSHIKKTLNEQEEKKILTEGKKNAQNSRNVWQRAQKKRFINEKPRILLLSSQYFLFGEIIAACESCGYEYENLSIDRDDIKQEEFMLSILEKVIAFQPDCMITLNHMAVDTGGIMTDMLERMHLPLASWFVDNPHLILDGYPKAKSPWINIFTWDADTVDSLKEAGHEHVSHLPLGTDPERFCPNPSGGPLCKEVCRDVSFVGNSMTHKVTNRLEFGQFPQILLDDYQDLAKIFGASKEPSVRAFLVEQDKKKAKAFDVLENTEKKLAYEAMLTWEATRQYRKACAESLLEFHPLFIGDDGWFETLKERKEPWIFHPPVQYYTDLPRVYPYTKINFNCTSKQMKGAVNQRIFDVPAAGSFVLTDKQAQMNELMEPGKEIIVYENLAEVPDLIRFYLNNPSARQAIIEKGRARVLAEHTWALRLKKMLAKMKKNYA